MVISIDNGFTRVSFSSALLPLSFDGSTLIPYTQLKPYIHRRNNQVYALLDKARATIARQEALTAEELGMCERSDLLDSSR